MARGSTSAIVTKASSTLRGAEAKSGQASTSARSCSGERAHCIVDAPAAMRSGTAPHRRASRVAVASGHDCRPELATSANRMLPGSYSQRGFSARLTLLSIRHGVGSSSVSLPWTCLTMSQVMLVSVAMPAALSTRPGAVQAETRTAAQSAAAAAKRRARGAA